MLTLTEHEVAALIPRHAWQLMDEEQRDALMREVVLPNYMETTADGVKLGPKWWAEAIGASARAVESRIYRLQKRQKGEVDAHADRNSRYRRAARQVLREADAEQVDELVEDLTPERRATLAGRLLADPDTRDAMVGEPEGVAAVEAIHRTATTRKQPVRGGEPLPPPPAFGSRFWRAVTAVQDASAELERFGVRGVEARPDTRAAAEQMAAQAAAIREAVAEYVVENIATEGGHR